jgi:hypothetical protein
MKTHHARIIRAGIMEARAQHKNEVYLTWKCDPPEGYPKLFMRAWDRTLWKLRTTESTEKMKARFAEAKAAFPEFLLTRDDQMEVLRRITDEDPDMFGPPDCCDGGCTCR